MLICRDVYLWMPCVHRTVGPLHIFSAFRHPSRSVLVHTIDCLSGFCSLLEWEGGLPSWIECYIWNVSIVYDHLWNVYRIGCIGALPVIGARSQGEQRKLTWGYVSVEGNMAAQQRLYHVYRVQRVVCPCLMLWCSTRTVITFITNLCHFHYIKSKKKWCLCS